MKTSNIQRNHNYAIIQGWVEPATAGTESGTGGGGTVTESENAAGADLAAGDVVVLAADGTVTTTTTPQDTRPVGVALDDIADGEFGPIAWQGPVDRINTSVAVTAGEYAETTSSPGRASGNATRRQGSFGYFTGSGSDPAGFLFGAADPSDPVSGDLYLTRDTGEEHVVVTVDATGSAETLDLSSANVFDLTLDDDCTITLASPSPSGVRGEWVVVLRQDGTGGRTVTWPASVLWQDTDGTATSTAPDLHTAANAIDTVLLITHDGGTTYGATLHSSGASLLSALGDVTVTSPAAGDRLRYDGTVWRNSALIWRPLTVYDGTYWLPLVDGDGNQLMAEA